MTRLFVRHDVEDYSAWRSGYDRYATLRGEYGVKGDGVYQNTSDPNDVTVWHDFDSTEAAESFVKADELAEAMQELGVSGPPQIWITSEA